LVLEALNAKFGRNGDANIHIARASWIEFSSDTFIEILQMILVKSSPFPHTQKCASSTAPAKQSFDSPKIAKSDNA
jgi:hypothetical protein